MKTQLASASLWQPTYQQDRAAELNGVQYFEARLRRQHEVLHSANPKVERTETANSAVPAAQL